MKIGIFILIDYLLEDKGYVIIGQKLFRGLPLNSKRGTRMCDVKKFKLIYEEISNLNFDDTLQLVLELETEEEKEFYEMIGNYLLQKEQEKVIEANKF